MNIFYKPSGPAKEYADDPIMRTEGWAANTHKGCLHGCKYCYVPDTTYWRCHHGASRRKAFHAESVPRKDIVSKIKADCKRSQGMKEPVFFSFTSDLYQPFVKPEDDVTREILLICEEYDIKVTILTKGGQRAERDFDIMARNGWKFGTTITGGGQEFEPNSAHVDNRMCTIKNAHDLGIYTWVSVEPVLHTGNVLYYITQLKDYVDFWKVGKLNHGKKLGEPFESMERDTNWGEFLHSVESIIPKDKLLIKHDLEEHRIPKGAG